MNRTRFESSVKATQLSLFDVNHPRDSSSSTPNSIGTPAQDRLIDYELVRSRRKTMSLMVRNAQLIVRAPLRAPRYWIEEVVESKSDWIRSQIRDQLKQRTEVLRVLDGHCITINGQKHRFCFVCDGSGPANKPSNGRSRGRLVHQNQTLYINFPDSLSTSAREEYATRLFIQWLKRNAARLLDKHVERLSRTHGFDQLLRSTRYRITRSKWGHCTADGEIQLNPTICFAPESVRDYVIVHELCHLKHRNHSKRFWALVETCDPHWKQSESWLTEDGHRVAIGSLLP